MPHNPANRYPDAPRAAVGAVVIHENRVLLVKRGRAPAKDSWAIPGGSVHLGETLQSAAEREVLEETGVTVRAGDPVFTFDAIDRDETGGVRFHYIIVDLVAEYLAGDPRPGDDAADARWIAPGELASLPVNRVTRRLLADRFGFGIGT
jgi:ADP-ribose pyrophosphatase